MRRGLHGPRLVQGQLKDPHLPHPEDITGVPELSQVELCP